MIHRCFRGGPVRVALLGVALTLTACEDRAQQELRALQENERERTARIGATPEALMVSFRSRRGTGLSREGWELQVLQMGSDIRLRGELRLEGRVVPIYSSMPRSDYDRFWGWLRDQPYAEWQPRENASAPESQWERRLEIDVVHDGETREKVKGEWKRPLLGDEWVGGLEARLNTIVLDLAEREIARQRAEEAADDGSADVSEAVLKATKELDDAHPSNLPGGTPE